MTPTFPYPAYEQFANEIGRGFSIWRVYMALRPPRLEFTEKLNAQPCNVKVEMLAKELRMSERKVRAALDWLTSNGYLREHGRDGRGVRSLTVAHDVRRDTAA